MIIDEDKHNKEQINVVSRRQFIEGIAAASATVIVFGTTSYHLWNIGANDIDGSSVKFAIPNSNGYIIFDPALCTGCQSCEISCTTFNHGISSLSLSRIQIQRDSFNSELDNYNPTPCLQCKDPPCVPVCPVTAIKIDESSGTNARIIDETECIGCEYCLKACEKAYGISRIRFNIEKDNAIKCHLCHGKPRCVQYCSNNALKYVTELPDEVIQNGSYNQAIFQNERENDIPRRLLQ